MKRFLLKLKKYKGIGLTLFFLLCVMSSISLKAQMIYGPLETPSEMTEKNEFSGHTYKEMLGSGEGGGVFGAPQFAPGWGDPNTGGSGGIGTSGAAATVPVYDGTLIFLFAAVFYVGLVIFKGRLREKRTQ